MINNTINLQMKLNIAPIAKQGYGHIISNRIISTHNSTEKSFILSDSLNVI